MDKVVISPSASLRNLPLGNFTLDWYGPQPSNNAAFFNNINANYTMGFDLYFDTAHIYFAVASDIYYAYGWDRLAGIGTVNHHWEMDFSNVSGTSSLYIDGIQQPVTYTEGTIVSYNDSFLDFGIGQYVNYDYPSFDMIGKLYWFRVSNIIRHTSNFTPPSTIICPPNNSHTLLRYALDEGTGSIAYDSSGNANNGIIYGAKWETD